MFPSDLEIWKDSLKWNFEGYPLFTSVYLKLAEPKDHSYHLQWKFFINYFHRGMLEGYLPEKELLEKGRIIISDIISGKDEVRLHFFDLRKRMKKAMYVCSEALRNGKIIDLDYWWFPSQKILSEVPSILFNFDFALNDYLKDLQENDKRLYEALISNINKEEKSFIKSANDRLMLLKKKNKNFDKIYEEFMKEFGWFQNSYRGKFKITKKWLRFYIKGLKKEYRTIKGKKPISARYAILAKAASEAIAVRDDKKKLLLLVVDCLDVWLKNVSKKTKISYNELVWLTVDEILLLNKQKKYKFLAEHAFKHNYRCGIMTSIGYNSISLTNWRLIEEMQRKKENKEIIGIRGNQGKAIGIVKIILNPKKERSKFNEGDILVTSMTRPEFVNLMNLASAFVTDEGGITSHAAIIARELKKPCIIGTKIATKVLKDGDIVEVNANNGVVTVIKRKK